MREMIDRFCSVMADGLLERSAHPGGDVWPQPVFDPAEGDSYAYEEFFNRAGELLESVGPRRGRAEGVARLLGHPSRIAHLLYMSMGSPADESQSQHWTGIVQVLLEAIAILRPEDPFCLSGQNRLWTEEQVDTALSTLQPCSSSVGRAPSESLARLSVSLSAYAEFLYFAHVAFGREFHGPYDAPDGTLLVREYHDLRPAYWPFADQMPCEAVTLLALYDAEVEFRISFSGRLIARGSLRDSLKGYAVLGPEGKNLLPAAIGSELLDGVAAATQSAIEHISSLGKSELILKWIESCFWAMRPLAVAAGLDWRPPSSLLERVFRGVTDSWLEEILGSLSSLPHPARRDVLLRLFDPRFVGKRQTLSEEIRARGGCC